LSDDDELVQKNSNFVEPQNDETEKSSYEDNDEVDETDEDDDEEEDEDFFQIKSVLAKALAKSRSLPRPAIAFVKKN
jgi:hypothetical protein